MKKAKNGWHCIGGCDVYVKNNIVLRGLKDGGRLPAYPYRYVKTRNGGPGWIREDLLTVAAFTAGVRRGTIKLF